MNGPCPLEATRSLCFKRMWGQAIFREAKAVKGKNRHVRKVYAKSWLRTQLDRLVFAAVLPRQLLQGHFRALPIAGVQLDGVEDGLGPIALPDRAQIVRCQVVGIRQEKHDVGLES